MAQPQIESATLLRRLVLQALYIFVLSSARLRRNRIYCYECTIPYYEVDSLQYLIVFKIIKSYHNIEVILANLLTCQRTS